MKYTGLSELQHDIDNLKAALAGVNVEEAFLYCWNDDQDASLIRRPAGRLAPGVPTQR